ncbi:MAG: hypothetical protein JWR66_3466, partial [Modestobacter sp.]|nr:hypothetical protein [Modestobacter sp.]
MRLGAVVALFAAGAAVLGLLLRWVTGD